jgi:enterochelin esterase-like enzyme
MHDGQNLFSAHTAGFGAEWRLDEIADSLITAGLIRPLIIVGIFNTGDRNLEYANGNIGPRYRDFVVHKIKPFIDKKYRTLPDQKYTVTGGSSMGGLVAFILLWENPEIFSGAICMSPAIFTGSQAADG